MYIWYQCRHLTLYLYYFFEIFFNDWSTSWGVRYLGDSDVALVKNTIPVVACHWVCTRVLTYLDPGSGHFLSLRSGLMVLTYYLSRTEGNTMTSG